MMSFFSKLIALSILFYPYAAAASSCKMAEVAESAQKSEIIFYGRAVSVDFVEPRHADLIRGPVTGDCGDKNITFQILDPLKGVMDKEATVFASDGCGGLGGYFAEGKDYLVYAIRFQDKLVTSVCNRTRGADASPSVAEDIAQLKTLTNVP
jgi:hypothetical protein